MHCSVSCPAYMCGFPLPAPTPASLLTGRGGGRADLWQPRYHLHTTWMGRETCLSLASLLTRGCRVGWEVSR